VEGFKSQLMANQNFGAAVGELPDLDGDNMTEIAVGSYMQSTPPMYFLFKNTLAPVLIPAPKIYTVTPAVLATAGGQTLTLYAAVDVTLIDVASPLNVTVNLGSFPCLDATLQNFTGTFPAQIVSADQKPFVIVCTTSPGVGGHLQAAATLSQGGGEVDLLLAAAVSYQPPNVVAIQQTGTLARGGFDITVTGSSFGAQDFAPMVLVAGSPCKASVWVSDALVVCRSAPAGLGNATVQVTVGGQTSPGDKAVFHYDMPALRGWNVSDPLTVFVTIFKDTQYPLPYSPYTGGGELMQLWGQNFGPVGGRAKVMLGPMECIGAVVVSDELVTCTTPSGAGGGYPIALTIATFTATYSNFSFGMPLVLTIIPDQGSTDGGDMVLMGRNFGDVTTDHEVLIGTQQCENIKVVYDHQLLTCRYPAGPCPTPYQARHGRVSRNARLYSHLIWQETGRTCRWW
jgi:hypothetical protein